MALGRSRPDRALASKLAPKEPRAERAQYLKLVRSLWTLWEHDVLEHFGLNARADQKTDTSEQVPTFRLDAPTLQASWDELFRNERLGPFLDKLAGGINSRVRAYYSKIYRIPPPRPADAAQLVAEWRRTNIRLIKGLGEDQIADLETTFANANGAGLRHEEIAAHIKERLGVGESRARLIARDQTLKYNSSVHAAQQRAAGITEFVWSTSHDSAVRESHAELDGKRFAWASPPIVAGEPALPGQPINCRCVAVPVVPLFDGI
jgi:SPP1 gp7 family putative phage head morphogenesis protein